MAKQQRNRQKKLERKKQKRRERQRQARSVALTSGRPPSGKLALRIDTAHELIQDREFEEAEEVLDELAKRKPRSAAVAEAQLCLYQATGNHEASCRAARMLIRLTPDDPDAVMIYAQESMFCGRASVALLHYREVMHRWPDHPHTDKARTAIEVCEQECERRLADARKSGFTNLTLDDGGLELYAQHETSLERMHDSDFKAAIAICERILQTEPGFVSARNNLATCCFHSGQIDRAVEVVKQTCVLAPDNRFAEALLAELEFLTGNADEANAIADRFVPSPAAQQDPLVAEIKVLSFLGRDEEVLDICRIVDSLDHVDAQSEAVANHYHAVAAFRLGDEGQARAKWKKCLRLLPTHHEARENLADLESGTGHAPWGDALAKWIPHAMLNKVVHEQGQRGNSTRGVLRNYPAIASLVPALLDRGDPAGRQFALITATADGSPESFEALRQFAFSQRGPDAIRHKALLTLRENREVDRGPHRFFSRGAWTEVTLFGAEIHSEVDADVASWESELAEIATHAMHAGDYDEAEETWERVLARKPDSVSAAFNLAVVWMERDGQAGARRAKARIHELHEQHPDYLFATIAIANFAAISGDLEKAAELLKGALDRDRLHVSEASALFAAQAQIAIKRKELDTAEQSLRMLEDLNGPDHSTTVAIRELLARARTGNGLGSLLRTIGRFR